MSLNQVSIWDILGEDPGPARRPETATPAAAEPVPPKNGEEPIALQVDGDEMLRPVAYEYAEAVLCLRRTNRVRDGIGDGTHYLLMRFHEDARREIATRKVRDELWARGEQFAIDIALHDEAQGFFYHRTRNARPRVLGKMV